MTGRIQAARLQTELMFRSDDDALSIHSDAGWSNARTGGCGQTTSRNAGKVDTDALAFSRLRKPASAIIAARLFAASTAIAAVGEQSGLQQAQGGRACDGARETRDSVRDKGSGRSNLVISEESPAERIPDIGEAQTENDPDADEEQLTGTTSEAYIDLLHMADHLRLMGRAYRDSSPDALHVVRDGLLRPFTYSTVFRHLPTCRESLEFIYADPLDIDDCPVIAFGQRLWQGHNGASGGGSGDTPSDAEQAFTLDDVRQFTEIDAESSDHKKAADYENMLEAVFGYEIEFDDEVYNYSDADKIRQLQNLAKANVHIVDYLGSCN